VNQESEQDEVDGTKKGAVKVIGPTYLKEWLVNE